MGRAHMSDIEFIPHTVTVRPDTGLYNAKFGMWLFLASEVMLFGALFSSYILLRVGAPSWPNQSEVVSLPIGTINTIIMISSSMTMVLASNAIRLGHEVRFKKWLMVSIVLALLFLTFKGVEYVEHLSHHEYPKKHVFLALYYLMTGVHALHIMGAIIAGAYLLGPGRRLLKTAPVQYAHRIEMLTLYWNFVDIVWIFILIALYLL
jgi:cytochrome c oxidase subunit III